MEIIRISQLITNSLWPTANDTQYAIGHKPSCPSKKGTTRRERDSNPRSLSGYTISSRAPSPTRPSLLAPPEAEQRIAYCIWLMKTKYSAINHSLFTFLFSLLFKKTFHQGGRFFFQYPFGHFDLVVQPFFIYYI